MKYLPEGAGSPISRMPQQQKAGYGQYTNPFLASKGFHCNYVSVLHKQQSKHEKLSKSRFLD
jgi:hypothetical protein